MSQVIVFLPNSVHPGNGVLSMHNKCKLVPCLEMLFVLKNGNTLIIIDDSNAREVLRVVKRKICYFYLKKTWAIFSSYIIRIEKTCILIVRLYDWYTLTMAYLYWPLFPMLFTNFGNGNEMKGIHRERSAFWPCKIVLDMFVVFLMALYLKKFRPLHM